MINKNPPNEQSQILKNTTTELIQQTSKVYSNVDQEIIVTTEDKIRLCLIEHLSKLEKKDSWITPFGILLTIIIIFPTTDFKDFLFLSADTWEAIFILSGLICIGWLIKSLWHLRVSSSLDEVVNIIKQTKITQ